MRGITLNTAMGVVDRALKQTRERSLSPLTIVVLDNGGHVKASVSEDGSGTARYDIALGKASAALGMGFGTRQFHNLVQREVLPEMFANTINGASGGKFIPLPGGVLILDGDNVIGAVGISGASSDQDEAVALTAIASMGLQASP